MIDISTREAVELNSVREVGVGEIFGDLLRRWKLVAGGALVCGLLTLGGTFLISPSYSARVSFLPPQQNSGSASAALASLGALAGFVGGATKTSGDQYLALLQSNTLVDRMVDRFDLLKVYDEELRVDARQEIIKNTRLTLGRKDGILTIDVEDHSAQRATDMANAYVEELSKLAAKLALTEAQQRRVFFESQLEQARKQLSDAQLALQAAGFNAEAMKAEPKATAEAYAKLRAEVGSAEIRLSALRRGLSDATPEVQRQLAVVGMLQSDLKRRETNETGEQGAGYISAYREFKYRETLFDLIARQFEAARVDESRDGAQLQVIDVATLPERKSKPRRGVLTVLATLLAFLAFSGWTVSQSFMRRSKDPMPAA
jgi:uncharacterized protein involved in exopolysaccharide biosynthesis